jgi:Arc/MetJ family transcription regulator
MRTTVTIDDALFQRALDLAEPGTAKGDIVRQAFEVFVRVQAGKRLAALGGQAPAMRAAPRRKTGEPRGG